MYQWDMAGLGEYRRKRNAGRTPEPIPADDALPRGRDDTFVIQEHHARRLHWDVRLERDGVLVSWAVPKGLPTEPGDIRLAVHTEDHPVEYATFEGEIPRGEYGGGTMTIWDRGRYETLKWSDREVAVVFHGEKAKGRYTFFKGKSEKDWMVRRSEAAPPGWTPLPETVEPMLATAGPLPSAADDDLWAYEFKWDGVRGLARCAGGRLTLLSRLGNDITSHYPELRLMAEELGAAQVWLDGEIVVLENGKPSFHALQKRMHTGDERGARRWAAELPATYIVFDLLHLDGHSTMSLPFSERRALLEGLELRGARWLTSPSYPGEGAAVVEAAGERGLEGVVAKRLTSRYLPGRRSPDWVKIANIRTREVVVGGWTPGEGKRSHAFGSLMLGVPTEDGLLYVGQVGTGFSEAMLGVVMARLKQAERRTSPFCNEVPRDKARNARWVSPSLVGEVVYRNWTGDRKLRAAAWRGLRDDKRPEDVERWTPDAG